MKYCKVENCQYPYTHVTRNHICEKCNSLGHGYMECNDHQKKNNLKRFWKDVLPKELWCTIKGCKFKRFHSNEDHFCHCVNLM